VPLAVLTLSFDPVLRLSDTASVRSETIAVGVVLFLGLVLAGRIASITPTRSPVIPPPGLRIDDLVFAVVGAVPGALVGGRLGYVLDHLAYYQANPNQVTDLAQGGMTLTLAIPLGLLTGGLIIRLLGAPVGRWLHALALPLLFVLGAGKLVGILGATGQGAPSDLSWATAYAGPGPWSVLGAEIPAHPSQVYEAVLVGGALVVMVLLSRLPAIARKDGAAMFLALGLWALVRIGVGFTWREAPIAGSFRVEQLLAMALLAIAIVGFLERWRARDPVPAGLPVDLRARPA
jgi:phosphatidylglycerol:prolipoprotein diacylglycerol transferase